MSKKILKEFYASGEYDENWPGLKIRTTIYFDRVKSNILQILLDINNIGEKSFQAIKDMQKKFDVWCNDHQNELKSIVNKFENNNSRVEYCSEYCYNKFFKDNNLSIGEQNNLLEKRKSSFDILKKNKIPLSNEEKSEVMKSNATWNHGSNGKPSPAVWKSKNSKGEIIYVTNTHRAYNTAKTLKGAINRFHNFIKGTA